MRMSSIAGTAAVFFAFTATAFAQAVPREGKDAFGGWRTTSPARSG